jgi:hypothetical protein
MDTVAATPTGLEWSANDMSDYVTSDAETAGVHQTRIASRVSNTPTRTARALASVTLTGRVRTAPSTPSTPAYVPTPATADVHAQVHLIA